MKQLPSKSEMIRAITARDESYVGVFVVAVKSTGIFCRPGCPARTPGDQQMEFYSSPDAALRAGYRPCKRCRPMSRNGELPPLVSKLQELVEQEPGHKITYADLQAMDIDPSTARRQFQRHFGMSFNSYQRARRLGMALRTIKKGERVLDAGFDSGYESVSGFREAFIQLFGQPPSRATQTDCMTAALIETPLGPMLAIADDDSLHLLEFVDRRRLTTELEQLRKRQSSPTVPGSNKLLQDVERQVAAYFDGRLQVFDIPLHTEGTEFQEHVWSELRKIPYGTTISYGELAGRVGDPQASRAVGSANGANQIAIIIPCHRVIRADGALSGYGGKVWRKRRLLDLEEMYRGERAAESVQRQPG